MTHKHNYKKSRVYTKTQKFSGKDYDVIYQEYTCRNYDTPCDHPFHSEELKRFEVK